MITTLVLFAALFVTMYLLIRILQIAIMIKYEKTNYDDNYSTFIIGLICTILWSIFYYLTHN